MTYQDALAYLAHRRGVRALAFGGATGEKPPEFGTGRPDYEAKTSKTGLDDRINPDSDAKKLVDVKVDPGDSATTVTPLSLPPISVSSVGNVGGTTENAFNDASSGHGLSIQDRRQQQAYLDSLYAQMSGRGPSISGTMLAQGQDRFAQNLASTLAGNRGLSTGSAARMAVRGAGANNLVTQQQAQVGRLQEEQQAREAYANALNYKRQQDIQQQMADTGLGGTAGGVYTTQRGQDIQRQESARDDALREWAARNNLNLQQGIANQQSQTQIGAAGLSAAGALAAAAASAAHGGQIPTYADGGDVGPSPNTPEGLMFDMSLPPHLIHDARTRALMHDRPNATPDVYGGARDAYARALMAERRMPQAHAQGGYSVVPPMLAGGPVPGRAAVAGDSVKNDNVLTRLSPGEGVIPRTIMKSPNAPRLAAAFVADMKKNHKMAKSGDAGPMVARAHKIKQHLKHINDLLGAE